MKKIIHLVFLLAGLLGLAWLAGCNAKPATTAEEDLLGLTLDYTKSEITVTVISKGCTRINDFSLQVMNGEITVKRNKKDECKAMPEPVSFTYAFGETGIEADKHYVIRNKFIANPHLANIR